jgi:uncharacterized protein YdaU (DUF1376 family)
VKNPWMPIYWRDYLGDTADFTTLEHGAYLLLIAHYWINGSLPDDDARLARIAKVSRQQWVFIRGHIAEKFTEHWRHSRIEHEFAKALKLHERKRENDRRWADKRRTQHGRAVGDNHNHNHKEDKGPAEEATITPGFPASPGSPEFQKWKAWAFEKNVALWRELQSREIEGRAFNFATHWPPN